MKEEYELRATTRWDADRMPHIGMHARQIFTERATFAKEILARWALVSGEIDGEDSAGRSKLRRMEAAEAAKAACDIADAAFNEFHDRGWLMPVPSLDDLADEIKGRENKNG